MRGVNTPTIPVPGTRPCRGRAAAAFWTHRTAAASFSAGLRRRGERTRVARRRGLLRRRALASGGRARRVVLAANFPRTYHRRQPPCRRHRPRAARRRALAVRASAPSGKAAIGKALLAHASTTARRSYARKLSVAEGARAHRAASIEPYHRALARRIADTRALRLQPARELPFDERGWRRERRGRRGQGAPTSMLGDRDGTTCDPSITAFARERLAASGYDARSTTRSRASNSVRAYANPAAGRHSLQLEVNKRLYMDEAACARRRLRPTAEAT